MGMFNVILIIFAILNAMSIAYLSDGDEEFHFDKRERNGDYNFKYKLDNGEIYAGKTYHVRDQIYLMIGVNDTVYWIEIDKERDEKEFTKVAHIAYRKGNEIIWENELNKYVLYIDEGALAEYPYLTAWNLDNVCFSPTKNKEQTFDYKIMSLCKSREYCGTTYNETDDPLIQRINIIDRNLSFAVYEINFKEEDFASDHTFCRGISESIIQIGMLGSRFGFSETNDINPSLIRSLLG